MRSAGISTPHMLISAEAGMAYEVGPSCVGGTSGSWSDGLPACRVDPLDTGGTCPTPAFSSRSSISMDAASGWPATYATMARWGVGLGAGGTTSPGGAKPRLAEKDRKAVGRTTILLSKHEAGPWDETPHKLASRSWPCWQTPSSKRH